jgi:hypothetical protein
MTSPIPPFTLEVRLRSERDSNSVPSDGTTMLAGIGEQIPKELTALTPSKMRLRSWHRQSASTPLGSVDHRIVPGHIPADVDFKRKI